jgi:hypothetical protein
MHPFPDLSDHMVPLLDDKKYAVQVRAAAAYIRLVTQVKPPATPKRHLTTRPTQTKAPATTTHR